MAPSYSFNKVLALVAAGRVRWSASRASQPLACAYGSRWEAAGLSILARINAASFNHTRELPSHDLTGPRAYDIHKVCVGGRCWYVKLAVERLAGRPGLLGEQVFALSCHPA
jgi:hypothetical protein